MREEEVNRLLNTIGKETFIKYYYDFRNKDLSFIKNKMSKNENWKQSSINTKSTVGKKILNLNAAKKALEIILKSRVKNELIDAAFKILNKDFKVADKILFYKLAKDKLKGIGKSTFIKYYFEFKTNSENLRDVLSKNNWTQNSLNSKIYNGKSIFSCELDKICLELVLSSRADKKTVENATAIFQKEYPNEEIKKIRFVRSEFVFGEDIINNLFSNFEIKNQYSVLNYFVDWYIPELNIVIEFDEVHHSRNQKEDKTRQQKIEKKLKCKFLRFTE